MSAALTAVALWIACSTLFMVGWCLGYNAGARDARRTSPPWAARSIAFGDVQTYTTSVADSGHLTERTQ
jgi:hypothetical protein